MTWHTSPAGWLNAVETEREYTGWLWKKSMFVFFSFVFKSGVCSSWRLSEEMDGSALEQSITVQRIMVCIQNLREKNVAVEQYCFVNSAKFRMPNGLS